MHLKRNIGVVRAPLSAISPTVPPPIPSKPMVESAPTAPAPPKPSPEKTTPFTNVPLEKSSKLAALEASGSKGYVLVSSPTVCNALMSSVLFHLKDRIVNSEILLIVILLVNSLGWIIPKGQDSERKEAASNLQRGIAFKPTSYLQ